MHMAMQLLRYLGLNHKSDKDPPTKHLGMLSLYYDCKVTIFQTTNLIHHCIQTVANTTANHPTEGEEKSRIRKAPQEARTTGRWPLCSHESRKNYRQPGCHCLPGLANGSALLLPRIPT